MPCKTFKRKNIKGKKTKRNARCRKSRSNIRKMRGGASASASASPQVFESYVSRTLDADQLRLQSVLNKLEHYFPDVKTEYERERLKLIENWTKLTYATQHEYGYTFVDVRRDNINTFIDGLINEINKQNNTQKFKIILSKEIKKILKSSTLSEELKDFNINLLTNKFDEILAFLSSQKIIPKPDLSNEQIAKNLQASRELLNARKSKKEASKMAQQALQNAETQKLINHETNMKNNHAYRTKFEREIEILNNIHSELVKYKLTDSAKILHIIANWYNYDDETKKQKLTNLLTKYPI